MDATAALLTDALLFLQKYRRDCMETRFESIRFEKNGNEVIERARAMAAKRRVEALDADVLCAEEAKKMEAAAKDKPHLSWKTVPACRSPTPMQLRGEADIFDLIARNVDPLRVYSLTLSEIAVLGF